MTVSSETARNDYVGTGLVDTYDYTFRIQDEADLRVTTRDTGGTETVLELTTDYTVDGVGEDTGGSVTLVAGALTDDYAIAIRLYPSLTQETSLRDQTTPRPPTLEDLADRQVMIAQRLNDALARSMTLPESEAGSAAATTLPAVTARAGGLLGFDGDGNPVIASQEAFVWRGAWSSLTAYSLNDVVIYNGSAYIATSTSTNDTPPGTSWELMVAGGDGADGADGAGYLATSVTSLTTAATGSKVFTTQAGLAYSQGARIRATSRASADWMEGLVTAYSGTTLTVTMDKCSGSGTRTDWDINVTGEPGAAGAAGADGASGTGDTLFAGLNFI